MGRASGQEQKQQALQRRQVRRPDTEDPVAAIASDDERPSCNKEGGCEYGRPSLNKKKPSLCWRHYHEQRRNDPTRPVCKQDGCSNVVKARGLCESHYRDYRRARARRCTYDGCDNPIEKLGLWCDAHYKLKVQAERITDPDWPTCDRPTCTEPVLHSGLCKSHYLEERRGRLASDPNWPHCAHPDGCSDPVETRATGLCTRHAARLIRTGDVGEAGKRQWNTCDVLKELQSIGFEYLANVDDAVRDEELDSRGLLRITGRYSRGLVEAVRQRLIEPAQLQALPTTTNHPAEALVEELFDSGELDSRCYRRPSISRELRIKIYRRDNFLCRRCKGKYRDRVGGDSLRLDHFVPRSSGGPDTEDNLWTLCGYCNAKKRALWPDLKNLEEWIRSGREILSLYERGWERHGGAPIPSPERVAELRLEGERQRLLLNASRRGILAEAC